MDSTTTIGYSTMCFAGYFAIMNPLANTALFAGLTAGDDKKTKRKVAVRSLLLAFGIIAVVSVSGNALFQVFGITLPVLRLTGGFLVFVVGYHMLQGAGSATQTPSDRDAAASQEAELSVAVSPLGVPILAGPGTIATAMHFGGDGVLHMAVSLASFAAICVVSFVCFASSDRIVSYLGSNGLNVVTRLMGLIVACIGTSMLLAGIAGWRSSIPG